MQPTDSFETQVLFEHTNPTLQSVLLTHVDSVMQTLFEHINPTLQSVLLTHPGSMMQVLFSHLNPVAQPVSLVHPGFVMHTLFEHTYPTLQSISATHPRVETQALLRHMYPVSQSMFVRQSRLLVPVLVTSLDDEPLYEFPLEPTVVTHFFSTHCSSLSQSEVSEHLPPMFMKTNIRIIATSKPAQIITPLIINFFSIPLSWSDGVS